MPPRLEIVKQPPCMSVGGSLPARAFSDSSPKLARESRRRPCGWRRAPPAPRVRWACRRRIPMCTYFLRMRFSPPASSEALKRGNSCSALTHARMMKASGVSLTPAACALSFRLARISSSVRDVGFIELRDVRDVDPARMQPRARDALDARQRLGFHGSELREVDYRHGGQCACARWRRRLWRPRRRRVRPGRTPSRHRA